MNKRDQVLNVIQQSEPAFVPAAFFLHFDPQFHQGQAAIDKHLEFFRATGMDLVKIQYEQLQPPAPAMQKPADWANVPLYPAEFFEPTVRVVDGLVRAARAEALVILTVYSPFMWANAYGGSAALNAHLKENPDAVNKGLERMTENVLNLLRACKKVGVDGFYTSSQGGESNRFPGTDLFRRYIKPTDLAVWNEIKDCTFNILHVCDYNGPYDDLTPFLDYPGHVVNASLHVGAKVMTPKQMAELFDRPFMGGMERLGVIATGTQAEIRREAERALADAPKQFILGADCTVPSATPWDNLKLAVDIAHHARA